MLYPWPGGGELAAHAGLLSVGGCRGGLAPGALLVHQVAEPLAELLDGLALVSEYQEPEPFGLLGLLYKQFAGVRRGHVHLPFLVAAGGGSLGGGRWAVRLPRMIAAIFCAVNRPKSLPTAPPLGGLGIIFAQKSVAVFCADCTGWGAIGGILA